MRTHQRAVFAASVLLAGGTLFSGSPSAYANHLNYVEPTPYEAELAASQYEPAPEEEATYEATSFADFPDASLAEAMAALRYCESNNDYGANTGNGYYGAYQFALSTWEWLGYGGYPHEAPPSVQDEAALALYNIYGWSPWPACSAYLGLS